MKTIIFMSLLVSTLAFAREGRVDLSVGAGNTAGTHQTGYGNLPTGQSQHLSFGYGLSEKWTAELGYAGFDFGNPDTSAKSYSLGARYYFVNQNLSPYLLMGLGAVDTKMAGVNTMAPGAILGGGLEYTAGKFVSFGAEMKAVYSNQAYKDDPKRDGSVALMPLIFLRMHTPWTASQEKVSQPVVVQTKSETAPAQLTVAVGDSDHDGVNDDEDKCSNTAAGLKVNAYGCPVTEKASVRIQVEFVSGKSDYQSEFSEELKKLADFMKKYPQTVAEIEGHSDSTGNEAFNIALSAKRANTIRSVLIKDFGVEASRLTAKGYGPQKPVASNKTLEGRKLNRRVVATISEK